MRKAFAPLALICAALALLCALATFEVYCPECDDAWPVIHECCE